MLRLGSRRAAPSLLMPCLLIALLSFPRSTSQADDPTPKRVEDIPWAQRTRDQKAVESSYEDEFSNKNKMVFAKDPFAWAYSKDFADRFGMPKEWIDPNLKGALAVAWRITTIGQTYCGHGGNPNLCWPSFTCQMDIYVDGSAPIPWRFSDVERDFLWRGLSSLDYIPKRGPTPRRSRYTDIDGRLGSKGRPFYTGGLKYKSKHYEPDSGSMFVIYFDRNYAPGVALLGFESACPNPKASDAAIIQFFTQEEQSRTQGRIQNYVHTVELSKEYMSKIAAIYEPESKRQKEFNPVRQQVMKKYAPN